MFKYLYLLFSDNFLFDSSAATSLRGSIVSWKNCNIYYNIQTSLQFQTFDK